MTSYSHGHSQSKTPPRILWSSLFVALIASVGLLVLNDPSTQNLALCAVLLAIGAGAGVWGARSQHRQIDKAVAAAIAHHQLNAADHLSQKARDRKSTRLNSSH